MIAFWTAICALTYAVAVVSLITVAAWSLILMLNSGSQIVSASGGTLSMGNSARPELEDTAEGSCEGRK